MNFKRAMVYTIAGMAGVIGYMKYKDGTLERTIKNMKPMIESTIENLKK